MPPGPSTANLSSYAPSRETFSDASGIINAFNAGLGDANLSPLADIAEGIDKGISLGAKANAFIDSVSPAAYESKQLDLEIKRSQASVEQQQGVAAQIQTQAMELNKESILLDSQLQAKLKVADTKDKLKQAYVLDEATDALSQIQDPQSFIDYLKTPKLNVLRSNPDYSKRVASTATTLLGTTNDPTEQVALVRAAEAASPGSQKNLIPLLPSATQQMLADPETLAKIEKSQAETAKLKAEAGQMTAQSAAVAANTVRAPIDPLGESLQRSGALDALDKAKPTPGATPPSTTGAPNMPAPPTPQSGTTTTADQAQVDAEGRPLRSVMVGTTEFKVNTPKPATLKEAQQEQVELIKQKIAKEEANKGWLNEWLASPGTPRDKLIDKITLETIQQNPGVDVDKLTPLIKLKAEQLDLKPAEYEERQKFSGNVTGMQVTVQKLESAMATVDAAVAAGINPSLGPNETLGQWFDGAIAKTKGSAEKNELINAKAVLEGEGFVSALQVLSDMKLGRISDMANTPTERAAIQALSTGKDVSIERNKQAIEILKGKVAQGKDLLDITEALRRAGNGYPEATDVADRYFRTNPYLEIDEINGVPSVKLKPNRLKVEDFLYKTLEIDKYKHRTQEGRIISGPPKDQIALALDLANQVKAGTATKANASDVSENMKQASPALFNRLAYYESTFNPDAVSKAGAQGLTQLMPGTGKEEWDKMKEQAWKDLKFEGPYDPFDVDKNAIIGLGYLNKQLRDFNGDTRLALAAYNFGPPRVKKLLKAIDDAETGMGSTSWEAVQQYLPKETKEYVSNIMGDTELKDEKRLITPGEVPGAIATLPTTKSQEYAQSNLTPEGLTELQKTSSIKRIEDTKGTILENAMSALLSANPFAATEAKAETPEETTPETGSSDTRTRVLNDDGSTTFEGMLEAGNIDLGNRPEVKNEDGTVSTVKSISFQGVDGSEVLIPTISNDGKVLSTEEAINNYRTTGNHLGKFQSPEAANAYAEKLHQQQAQQLEAKNSYAKQTKKEVPVETAGLSDGMQAFVLGAARGLLFGGEDEVFAGVRMMLHQEDWDTAVANTRKVRDELQKNSPWIYGLGQVAGGVASPIPGALFKGGASVLRFGTGGRLFAQAPKAATKIGEALNEAKTASLVGTIGKEAGKGAVIGGATGVLEGEAGERGYRAAEGALIGGLFGGAVGPIVYKLQKLGSAARSWSPEEREILKRMQGMSDDEFTNMYDELAGSTNPGKSLLSSSGLRKLRDQVDAIVKNPDVSSEAEGIARERLRGVARNVANDLDEVSDDVDSEDAAKAIGRVANNIATRAKKEALDIGDDAYNTARAAASKNTVATKGRFSKFKFADTAARADELVDEFGDVIETDTLVQRYREQGRQLPEEAPAFTSDGVYNAMQNPAVEDALTKAYGVWKQPGFQPNDFRLLQTTLSILKGKSKNGIGTERHVAAKAAKELEEAMYTENPALEVADIAYTKAQTAFKEKYSASVKKLEKYAVEGKTTDITKAHDDLMTSVGAKEIKDMMKLATPEEQVAFRNSARSYLLDTLADRGTATGFKAQAFKDFSAKGGEARLKAIFGEAEGSKLLSQLDQNSRISEAANKLITTAAATAPRLQEEKAALAAASNQNTTFAFIALAGASFWPGIIGKGATAYAGYRAVKSVLANRAFKTQEQMANGIAEILYKDPEKGLEFLQKISETVKKEQPQYYPTWSKLAGSVAELVVASGDRYESESGSKRTQENRDLNPKRPVEIYIKKGPQPGDPVK